MARKGELTWEILKILMVGGGILLASTSPYFGASLVRMILKHYKSREEVKAASRRLNELYKRKIIFYEELPNGQIKIVLTKEGKLLALQYQFEKMRLKRQKKWDGIWHFLIYDIPEKKKKARDALKNKLNRFGLFPLQKSIMVAPFDFRNEIEFICAFYKLMLDRDIFYFTSKEVPREQELKEFFEI